MTQFLMVNWLRLVHLKEMLDMRASDSVTLDFCFFEPGLDLRPMIVSDLVYRPRYLIYFLRSPGPITDLTHRLGSFINLESLECLNASARLRISTPSQFLRILSRIS